MPSLDCEGAAANTPFQCIYWNVRSISGTKNVKQLQHYINEKQVDALFLSETWQRRGHPLPELQGYSLISRMSDQTGGRGGVACYYKREYGPYISCHKSDPEGHYLWMKLDQALGFEHDVFAAVCYFPPAKSSAYEGRDRLEPHFPYTRLNHDLLAFSTKKGAYCDFFVVGDFNSRIGNAQAPEAHRLGLARESADKKTNNFRRPLMDVCDKNDLLICNGVTQVWPNSGETTCRSKSVVDYILAPVSRARYLVKDIQILPLEKKSDHNALNFTLRRPRPLRDIPAPQEAAAAAPSPSAPSAPSPASELLHRPLSEPTAAATASSKATPVETVPEAAVNKLECESTSPTNVIMSSDDGAEASASTTQRNLNEFGTTFFRLPAWGRHERRFPERGLTGEVAMAQAGIPVERPPTQRYKPYTPPAFMNAEAWLEDKTSRLLNKILADGPILQEDRHRKPAAMNGHPLFPAFRKGYMTRNLDALTIQRNPKCSTNNNKLDMGLGSKEYWNRKVEEVSIQEPVFLLDKRELMTMNSRPASVASRGLVHVARLYVRADTSCRGQSSDGSRMTTSGSWGAKGLKMGPGYRCTCMCPGHHLNRQVPPPHPFFKSDTLTRSLTVVECSKPSTWLKSLKSTYDSGKLWSSIAQFKITRKIAKAIR